MVSGVLVWACSTEIPLEVTREVEVTREATVPQTVLVEVTRPAEEVTKLVEVTRVVQREITREVEVEVTRQIFVEVTPTPTSVPTATPSPTPSLDREKLDPRYRDALVALYNATDGPNWINNRGWLSDEPFTSWWGISTFIDTGTGSMVGIGVRLRANGLLGTIPVELGSLTQLQEIDLSRNHLTGEIPTELGSLTQLRVIDLSRNQLTGPIPESLNQLGNITILRLNDNLLSGDLSRLRGLTERFPYFNYWSLESNRFNVDACYSVGLFASLRPSTWYRDPPPCHLIARDDPILPDWVHFSSDGTTYWERAAMFGIQWSHELASELGVPSPVDRELTVEVSRSDSYGSDSSSFKIIAEYPSSTANTPDSRNASAFLIDNSPTAETPVPYNPQLSRGTVDDFMKAAVEMSFAFLLDPQTDELPSWLVQGLIFWLANAVESPQEVSFSINYPLPEYPSQVVTCASTRERIPGRLPVPCIATDSLPNNGVCSANLSYLSFVNTHNACHRFLSIRAVDMLASIAGLQEVVRFVTNPTPSSAWEINFATFFGISSLEFYRLFDEHRDAGFPQLAFRLDRPMWR